MKINKLQLAIGAVFLVAVFPIISSAEVAGHDTKTESVTETMVGIEKGDAITPIYAGDKEDMVDPDTMVTPIEVDEDAVMGEKPSAGIGEDEDVDVNEDTTNEFLGQRALDRMEKGFDRTMTAQERMSDVAKRVHELLNINPGNGQNAVLEDGNALGNGSLMGKDFAAQVQEVAKAQEKAQEKIQESFKKIDERSGFVKFLVGPDRDALKSLKDEIKANQERVKKLQDIQSQVENGIDKDAIQQTVMSILDENVTLQERVADEERGFSIVGFLMSLFS